MKVLIGWGGFVDGKLDTNEGTFVEEFAKTYAIFPTKKQAKKCYEDVRKIVILAPINQKGEMK